MKTVAALSASPVASLARARAPRKRKQPSAAFYAQISHRVYHPGSSLCWSQSASDLILLCYTVRLRRRIKWASRTHHQSVEMRFLNFFHSEEMKKKENERRTMRKRGRMDMCSSLQTSNCTFLFLCPFLMSTQTVGFKQIPLCSLAELFFPLPSGRENCHRIISQPVPCCCC
jgi:hypothetical protein